MFWGLIMEPERRYTQQIKKSFHISMAALDIASSGEEPAQVMCGYEGRNYLLCTLQQPETLQCHLDLEFAAGSQVSFASNGKAHVHLTGYLTDQDENGLNLADLEEQEEEEDVEEEEEEDVEEEEEVEEKRGKKKKLKLEQIEPPTKKVKLLNGIIKEELEEEESDDPDFEEAAAKNEESDEDEEASDEDEVEEEEGDSDEEEAEQEAQEEQKEVPQKLSKKQKKLLRQQQEQQQQQEKQLNGEVKKPKEKQKQKKQKRTLDKGVIVEDLLEGNGSPAKPGRFVNVYYEGRLEKSNKMFDATNKGPGFKFRLGAGEVIKAWDIGLVGMKVGGRRKIICPPHTAYGPKGSPPAIPPNSTLVFTVELKKVN